jgi:hypothetical protein
MPVPPTIRFVVREVAIREGATATEVGLVRAEQHAVRRRDGPQRQRVEQVHGRQSRTCRPRHSKSAVSVLGLWRQRSVGTRWAGLVRRSGSMVDR